MIKVRSDSRGPQIEWPAGRDRRPRRAAAVALEGAGVPDLRRAIRTAAAFDPRPVLVAVDGGLSTCRAARKSPDLFVGDLDSTHRAPPSVRSKIYPVDKDFSDFSGALGELRLAGVGIVAVAGLLGGRLDHEWANVLEIGRAAPEFTGILAPSDRGLVVVSARRLRARTRAGGLVSLFALVRGTKVSLTGTRWTLKRHALDPGSLGLSNVTGAVLSLEIHAGVVALVFPN